MAIEREGWGEEDGVWVHLESEAAVDPTSLVVLDLDDKIIADGFEHPDAVLGYVERRAEEVGHISEF